MIIDIGCRTFYIVELLEVVPSKFTVRLEILSPTFLCETRVLAASSPCSCGFDRVVTRDVLTVFSFIPYMPMSLFYINMFIVLREGLRAHEVSTTWLHGML